jgi:hypothetical protein
MNSVLEEADVRQLLLEGLRARGYVINGDDLTQDRPRRPQRGGVDRNDWTNGNWRFRSGVKGAASRVEKSLEIDEKMFRLFIEESSVPEQIAKMLIRWKLIHTEQGQTKRHNPGLLTIKTWTRLMHTAKNLPLLVELMHRMVNDMPRGNLRQSTVLGLAKFWKAVTPLVREKSDAEALMRLDWSRDSWAAFLPIFRSSVDSIREEVVRRIEAEVACTD